MIAKWLLTPALICCNALIAEDAEEPNYQMEQKQTSRGIQGIFLTGQREDVIPEGRPGLTGIQVADIEIPGGIECLADVLEPFLGKPMNKRMVIAIKKRIMTYYVRQGVTMIAVEAPKQRTKGGVVQFVIIQKRFGYPIYSGDIWYDDEKMNRMLGITPCQEICEENLKNDLAWFNRNPFHYTKMRFVPGSEPDVLNIEFASKSRPPLRLYIRGDDTGSFNTGYGRLYAGFVFANAFNRGDILSFEYECSNEFKRLQEYSANYTSFLPWQHIFTVLGTYATVKPSGTRNQFKGRAREVLPRYTIPFKPLYTQLQQSVTFGIDFKNTNTRLINLLTGEALVQSSDTGEVGESEPAPPVTPFRKEIDVTQLVGIYSFYNRICNHSLIFNLGFFLSPVQFLHHQTNSDYNSLRRHSRTKYCYLDVTLGDVITVPNVMTIGLLMRGQIASRTLPPTELFNVGGYNTVRGYHQAEASGDNAFVANLELRTLPFSAHIKCNDQMILLAFVDFGISNNWRVTPIGGSTPPHTQYLVGVGPGLRYAVNPTFQLRCDYGFKLHHLFTSTAELRRLRRGFGQLHVGALASF